MKTLRFLLVLLAAAGVMGFAVWRGSETEAKQSKLVGFQDFDVPLKMPRSGKPDMRFHFLSAWQANQVPVVTRMDTPMGSENGALVYNAQKFMETNAKRGGKHSGDDLNGIGGMDTDLGDPVFAAGDGLVVFAGNPSPGWGNIVILAHRDADGKPLHTMYGHLLSIEVKIGDLAARGTEIGKVGSAEGHYPAHLHFEVRASDGVDVGSGYTAGPLDRLDPASVVAALHNAEADGISPAPLAFATLQPEQPWTKLEIKNAGILTELKE